jgi:hypothetical protein
MATLLITFGLILAVVLFMAVGVMFGRKPLSGGCCDSETPNPDCAVCEKQGKNGSPCPGPQA